MSFVEKIVVHAASDPKGKKPPPRKIDIYYKGIGALESIESILHQGKNEKKTA